MTSFKQAGYPAFTGPAKIEYIKQGATNRGFVSLDPERQRQFDDKAQRKATPKSGAQRAGPTASPVRVGGRHSTGGFSRGNT
jgi:hypothetical protein